MRNELLTENRKVRISFRTSKMEPSYEHTINVIRELDPYGVLEISDHILPDVISEVFEVRGKKFTIKVPVKVLRAISRQDLDGIASTKSDNTEIIAMGGGWWRYIIIETVNEEERHIQLRIEVRYESIIFDVSDMNARRGVYCEANHVPLSEMVRHQKYPEKMITRLLEMVASV